MTLFYMSFLTLILFRVRTLQIYEYFFEYQNKTNKIFRRYEFNTFYVKREYYE